MFYLALYQLHMRYPVLNVLRYETFRSVLAGLSALLIALALGPLLIERFRAAHIGQTIREDVPQSHQKKAGTPTMGGLMIIASCLVATLMLADPRDPFIWIAIFVTVSYGAIGFADDFLKLKRGKGNGLSEGQKLAWQFGCAFVAAVWLFGILRFSTYVTVPFLKHLHPNLHWWGYVPFAMVIMVGCSNAVNLTDGLDGLAIGPVIMAAGVFALITYVVGNVIYTNYLYVHHVPRSGELAVLLSALVGAGLGFLWFNAPPAMVFMGDTGSLSIGGALGGVAVVTKHEIVLAIVGGLFVLETISVIVQVLSFRFTGKRIFRMAPLHHHFEQKGWAEPTIVFRFWIIAAILSMVGLATLKLR
jgi:phospho-N-acetylmuramoyl-pentapeptide-transferase